ncbi:MAG: 4Fe-4S binding protein [Candidatus Brocadiia bacterium]
MTEEGAWIDREKCVGCGACYENCASEAIEAIDESGDSDD